MTAPSFRHSTTFSLKDRDLLLLPWLDKKTPCFNCQRLETYNNFTTAPDEEGGSLTLFAGAIDGKRIMARAVRLDDSTVGSKECLKKAVAEAVSLCDREQLKRVQVIVDDSHLEMVRAAHEGAVLGGYRFDRYLSRKKPLPQVVAVTQKGLRGIRKQIEADAVLFESCNFARDILNEPPNRINPVSLARLCETRFRDTPVKLSVWDEKRLKKEKCGGILAVGQGAESKPRLLIGEYRPEGAKGHLALVGKGITFDTGGYCLKPASSQLEMKYDMGGAAAVIAATLAIAGLGLKIDITMLAPLAENDISSSAYHTSDIITTRAGISVQVDNTDAEGRLILSDALALACENKPDWIVDAATLTGACCVALGEDIAGLFGENDELNSKILECGRECGEHFWPLPLHMPYMDQLKANVADCKNLGGKWGGAITAALFLKKFVKDEIPWVHLDIAGPAVKEEPLGHLGKGAKGFGVRTLARLARALSA